MVRLTGVPRTAPRSGVIVSWYLPAARRRPANLPPKLSCVVGVPTGRVALPLTARFLPALTRASVSSTAEVCFSARPIVRFPADPSTLKPLLPRLKAALGRLMSVAAGAAAAEAPGAASLDADFDAAAAASKTLRKAPDNDTLLALYSLYKQASVGDVAGERPGALDMVNRAKFDAWDKRKGTSREDAMRAYIDLVGKLKSEEGG